jgi:hypothetical protein
MLGIKHCDAFVAFAGMVLSVCGVGILPLITVDDAKAGFKGELTVMSGSASNDDSAFYWKEGDGACGVDWTSTEGECAGRQDEWCHAIIGTSIMAVLFAVLLFVVIMMKIRANKGAEKTIADKQDDDRGYRNTVLVGYTIAAVLSMYISTHTTMFAVSGTADCGFNENDSSHIGAGAYCHLAAGIMYIIAATGHGLQAALWDSKTGGYNVHHTAVATVGYVATLVMMVVGGIAPIAIDSESGTLHSMYGTGATFAPSMMEYHEGCDAKIWLGSTDATSADNYCNYLVVSYTLPVFLSIIGIAAAAMWNRGAAPIVSLCAAIGMVLCTTITVSWTAYLFDRSVTDGGLVVGEVTWGVGFWLATASMLVSIVLLVMIVLVYFKSPYAAKFGIVGTASSIDG